jgi:SanA protein
MKQILKHKWVKHSVWVGAALLFCATLITIIVTTHIQKFSRPYIYSDTTLPMPNCYTVMVLGASVHKNGDLSPILLDRINSAVELYKMGKVKRFLLSGDHGRIDYDEVNTMKNHLIHLGIDSADIFLDHAGFDTYSSMVRAKEVFKVDSLYIVTQNYHLYRAVYIARQCGLNAYGYVADRRSYVGIVKYTLREWFANVKSWVWVNTNHKPVYLGEQIPITGESRMSWDVK